ncbi:hypothetical protein ABZ419_20120 [Streptomyces cinnamoneus]|uniref:hypothetical protein n=1 Tax=Streptomyces cinnamoneus TaxID=53446 RepID=UPI0033C12DC9
MKRVHSLQKFIGAFTIAMIAAIGVWAPEAGDTATAADGPVVAKQLAPGDSAWG